MTLRVIRERTTAEATIGRLFVAGEPFCWTLEDAIRDVKIKDRTAIPAGTYEVRLTHSPRFERILPELLHVPNFVGVRIHAGNRHVDTSGCVLVGRQRGSTFIGQSQLALGALMAKLVEATDGISITIENTEIAVT